MKNKNIIKACVAIAIGLMTSVGAQAAALNGDIIFAGTANLDAVAANATQINFTAGATVALGSTGDYAAISNGTSATFSNIDFDVVGYTGVLVVNNLWSVAYDGTTYSFDLAYITSNTISGGALILNGYGTAKSNDASQDDHFGGFYIRTTGESTEITFHASTDVPDSGTTVAFLGLSLLGLAGVSRRLRK
jgi:hypothetical protein